MTSPSVDAARLARAVHLEAERQPDGRWRVTGGSAPHVVDVEAGTCDCTDYAVRGGLCKHLARARLAMGDADLVRQLRAIVPPPKRARLVRLELIP